MESIFQAHKGRFSLDSKNIMMRLQELIRKQQPINQMFNKYFIDFSEIKWKKTFTLIKTITTNTKLIEFQFKKIHHVYANDSYVSHFYNSVRKHAFVVI